MQEDETEEGPGSKSMGITVRYVVEHKTMIQTITGAKYGVTPDTKMRCGDRKVEYSEVRATLLNPALSLSFKVELEPDKDNVEAEVTVMSRNVDSIMEIAIFPEPDEELS